MRRGVTGVLWAAGALGACTFTSAVPDAAPETPDAAVDAGRPSRVSTSLVGLWSFDEGSVDSAADTSGRQPPIALSLVANSNGVATAPGALVFSGVGALASPPGGSRLNTEPVLAGQVALEVWATATSADVRGQRGNAARVATLSVNAGGRNLTLGQRDDKWWGQLRTARTDANGLPSLEAPLRPGELVHLVVSGDNTSRRLFVDGRQVSVDENGGALNWDGNYRLAVGADPSLNNAWKGQLHLMALYARALTAEEVMQNFAAGP